jgi:hypothetical protein
MAGRAGVNHLPVATASTANRVVVPCRTWSWVRRSTLPGATGRIGWVRSSAWIWDFWSTRNSIACAGGSRYSPTTSWTRASSWGSVENLKVSVCQGLTSCSAQQPRGPVGHAEVLGWRGQRGGHDLGAPIAEYRLGPPSSRPVGQASSQSFPYIALTPGDHRRARDPKPLGRSRCWRRPRQPAARSWPAGPAPPGPERRWAQRRKTAWSPG